MGASAAGVAAVAVAVVVGIGAASFRSEQPVAAATTSKATPHLTVHVDGELYHQRGRGYRHTVPSTPDTQHGDFSKIAWDLNIASPDDQWSGWSASPGVRLDVRLGQRSSVHTSARYTRIGGDLDVQALAGLAPDTTASRVQSRPAKDEETSESKWLKKHVVAFDPTLHSFLHSFRSRLRPLRCEDSQSRGCVAGLRSGPSNRAFVSLLENVLVDLSILHDHDEVLRRILDQLDVRDRIPVDEQQVGERACFDDTEFPRIGVTWAGQCRGARRWWTSPSSAPRPACTSAPSWPGLRPGEPPSWDRTECPSPRRS